MGAIVEVQVPEFAGGCLCGAVRFESRVRPQVTVHCYCVDCRKTSGTGHGTHLVVPMEAFTLTGAVRLYERAADSGNIVTRGFCETCGSPVYSVNSGKPNLVFPRASLLDDPEIVQSQMRVYGSRAPSWDHAGPPSGV